MMQIFPPTVVIRHRKENRKKCSLRGLERREDVQFFDYPEPELPDLRGYVLLGMEGPQLGREDTGCGLLVLDGTWRYTEKMERWIEGVVSLPRRSLPSLFRTAYPRRQLDCLDPERGLASVEALVVAYSILGREWASLLEGYHWREEFLEKNPQLAL